MIEKAFSLARWCALSLVLMIGSPVCLMVGCGGSGTTVIEETEEYSFEDMAEMAARDTELSESGEDQGDE